jgi:hypothetical protein
MIKKCYVFIIISVVILSSQTALGFTLNKEEIEVNNFEFPSVNIIKILDEINNDLLSDYLEKIVSFGPRYVGTESCHQAAEYVNQEFQNVGLESYIDDWAYPKFKCKNVVATKNGTNPDSDAVIILCAHLDTTINSVGANDNGAGVAAILAIAKLMKNYKFHHTIKFVITSGEEVGCYGSFDYAKKAYNDNENIIACLNLDTIANTTCVSIIHAFAPKRSHRLFLFMENVQKKYEKYIDMKLLLSPHDPCDSKPFVEYGYDAMTFSQSKLFEYPLHTPRDTTDKIVYPYYENVTKLIFTITTELANKKIDLQVRIVSPKEGYVYLMNYPLLKLPGFNLHQTRIRGMTYFIGSPTVKINITTDEEIVMVTYNIDGDTDYNLIFLEEPFDWKIQKLSKKIFRMRGRHKLGVHVHTISGKTAYDEMDFFAITAF